MAGKGSEETTTVLTALGANGVIAVMKFTVAIISGSSAMLAEGFHSLADTGNQLFLLFGLESSDRPPDSNHPFGYGKDGFFWAFVVAVSMFTLGSVFSVYEGTSKILHPHGFSFRHMIYSVIVLVGAIGFESIALRKAWLNYRKQSPDDNLINYAHKTKNATLLTVLFEDLAAIIGLILALLGVGLTWLTGSALWDGISSIAIGLLLAGVAITLAWETRKLLLGERASLDLIQYVHNSLDNNPVIRDFEPVKTMQLGSGSVLVNVRVTVPEKLTAGEIDDTIEQLRKSITGQFSSVEHLYIEVDQ